MASTFYQFPAKVETDARGHQVLLDFYKDASKFHNCTYHLDWSQLQFMDANLAALLMAMIWTLRGTNKTEFYLDYTYLNGGLNVFHRNGLAHFIRRSKEGLPEDLRESTIPVRAFIVKDVDKFVEYIDRDFLRHRGMEDVQYEQKVRLKDSFLEIFSNVELHAQTENPVLACGQYFPKQKELKFTLLDMGCGFLSNISAFTKDTPTPVTTAEKAISWAVKGHTTKQEAAGGTGLSKILNFCRKNNGALHIISDGCYWAFENGVINNHRLNGHFSGATIHLIFRFE